MKKRYLFTCLLFFGWLGVGLNAVAASMTVNVSSAKALGGASISGCFLSMQGSPAWESCTGKLSEAGSKNYTEEVNNFQKMAFEFFFIPYGIGPILTSAN